MQPCSDDGEAMAHDGPLEQDEKSDHSPEHEREHQEIRRSAQLSRKWMGVIGTDEVKATCWLPEERILVRVMPRWTEWRQAAVTLKAGLGIGHRRPRCLVLIGPGACAPSADSWTRRLRGWAIGRGVRVSAHQWAG